MIRLLSGPSQPNSKAAVRARIGDAGGMVVVKQHEATVNLANEHVRTAAGVKRFHEPIGSPITRHLDKVLEGHNLKGRGTGSGSPTDPINVGGNTVLAVKLLSQGKHVRLNKVHDVGTLIDKLLAGLKAGANVDLCGVSVPKTNLFCAKSKGIPREKMPQLTGTPLPGSIASKLPRFLGTDVDAGNLFRAMLRKKGVKVTDETVQADSLKATQDQLVGVKVAEIAKAMRSAPATSMLFDPIFVTRDHYVLDGHHRWAAQVVNDSEDGKLGNRPMKVKMIDMDIGEALAAADAFMKDVGLPAAGFENGAQPKYDAPKAATMSLSTPIVSSEDGPRMSGQANFGGKKAAPFRKGGKPRRAVNAKRAVAKARLAKGKASADLSNHWGPWDALHRGSHTSSSAPKVKEQPATLGPGSYGYKADRSSSVELTSIRHAAAGPDSAEKEIGTVSTHPKGGYAAFFQGETRRFDSKRHAIAAVIKAHSQGIGLSAHAMSGAIDAALSNTDLSTADGAGGAVATPRAPVATPAPARRKPPKRKPAAKSGKGEAETGKNGKVNNWAAWDKQHGKGSAGGEQLSAADKERAIKGFQKKWGLPVTGTMNPATARQAGKVAARHAGDPHFARAATVNALAHGRTGVKHFKEALTANAKRKAALAATKKKK